MTDNSKKQTRTKPSLARRLLNYTIWGSLATALTIASIAYWLYNARHPSTDDAYVQANTVRVAAQISGPIAQIYMQNNDYVHKGQLLFTINPRPFQLAVAKAQAQLSLTKEQVQAAQMAVEVAQAQVEKAKANLQVAKDNAPRIIQLAASGRASKAAGSKARGRLAGAQAAYRAALSQLKEAKQQVGTDANGNSRIQAAQAALAQAQLQLQYTHIYAPSTGIITNFSLRSGTMVSANQPLFALIETDQWWVAANFKETDLKRIRPGQPAIIKLDIYPGIRFKGYVQSISAGSGSAFSLLPPENATGNWVKVTQRFTVKVILTDLNPDYPLRVGASSNVTIDTKASHTMNAQYYERAH